MKTSDKIEEKMLEAKISEILHKIGIPAHISGYRHIIEAILMVVYDKNRMTKINDLIYQEIANKNKKSKSAVERAMRRAIEIAWERGNLDYINEIFGYTINPQKGKPTNKEFIAMIANKITMEML
jgi:two-component system response regulator (stage 0 sporulation protein A)